MCGRCRWERETQTKEKNIFTTLQNQTFFSHQNQCRQRVQFHNHFLYLFPFFFFFLNLLFLTPQTHNKNLPKFFIFSLSLSSSLSTNKNHGSGGAQPTSHRSERARRSGHREVGHGPEAHGRPIHALPHLQRNRSSHLPLFALVRRRHRMLHMFRVGSHGLQQLRRLRHRPTLAGQNRDSPSQPPLLITAFSVSIAF